MISVQVPSSKSLTQRALILAALAATPTRVVHPLICDDSLVLAAALRRFGVKIDQGDDGWTITPPAKLLAPETPLQLGNAGTAVRFVTGLVPVMPGPITIDGDPAMRRRPMAGLLAALSEMGVHVAELGKPSCPPVVLTPGDPDGLPESVSLRAGGSSQELSALLLVGCRLPRGLRVLLDGNFPSRPYIELTIRTLEAFGVQVERPDTQTIVIPPQTPHAEQYPVEGDWSSASYPLAAGWLTGREVEVTNLDLHSAQGDRIFPQLLRQLNQGGHHVLAMGDVPDIVPTVVACALFAAGVTEITGVAHLRIKESNRLATLARELTKLGAAIRETPDGLVINPRLLSHSANLDPAADHRMAMAFGLISLRHPGIEILNPTCVSKSYPDFWNMLARFA
jgi:3-phosphoshikimate 1-carboxyvinyltransferase